MASVTGNSGGKVASKILQRMQGKKDASAKSYPAVISISKEAASAVALPTSSFAQLKVDLGETHNVPRRNCYKPSSYINATVDSTPQSRHDSQRSVVRITMPPLQEDRSVLLLNAHDCLAGDTRDPFDSADVVALNSQVSLAENLLLKFYNNCLSVTSVIKPLWCSRQVAYKARAPGIDMGSIAALRGTAIHQELEEKAYQSFDHIEVQYDSRIQEISYKLLNSLTALASLLAGKTSAAREVYVVGQVNYYDCGTQKKLYLRGYIDNLRKVENNRQAFEKQIMISDEKSRQSRHLPSESQMADSQVQLSIYHHLLTHYAAFLSSYFSEFCSVVYQIDAHAPLPDNVWQEAVSCGVAPVDGQHNMQAIALALADVLRQLPPLADDLELEYIHQTSRQMLGKKKFKYEDAVWRNALDSALPVYLGDLRPSRTPDDWKCGYCSYKALCRGNLNPAEEYF